MEAGKKGKDRESLGKFPMHKGHDFKPIMAKAPLEWDLVSR